MPTCLLGAASPFQTWEEFEGAIEGPTGGAIYTFADRPALIGIMVVVAALIFLYFIYASFHISSGESSAKSPTVLSALLIAGAASALTALYEGFTEKEAPRQAGRSQEAGQVTKSTRAMPAALFGTVGLASVAKRKKLARRIRLNR